MAGLFFITIFVIVSAKKVDATVGWEVYSSNGLNFLLLGDSFTAGNGALHSYHGIDGCYRAGLNWGAQFANWLRSQGHTVNLYNRACSGAIIQNIIQNRDWSSKNASISLPPSAGLIDRETAKKEIEKRKLCDSFDPDDLLTEDIQIRDVRRWGVDGETIIDYTCVRKVAAQSSWIGPEIDVVILTIGGNDLGFSKILATCVVPTTRYGYLFKLLCPIWLKGAYDTLGYVKSDILSALKKIRKSGLRDDAKIILVGYPHMSLDNGYLLGNLSIATHVRQIGRALSEQQSDAVREYNQKYPGQAYFVDEVKAHFNMHEPNLNVLFPNPNRWIHHALEPGFDFHEWYHPNARGHSEYANVLKKLTMDGTIKPIQASGPSIDIVFNIDTTSSMSSELAHMKRTIYEAAQKIRAQTRNARFAVTSFRNHPEITKNSNDYTAFANLYFTQDIDSLIMSIDGLIAQGSGGVGPKTTWSGIMTGLNMKWRPGVEKVIVTVTNSKPYAREPFVDYTKEVVANKAFSVDPAQLYFIVTNHEDETIVNDYKELAEASGGYAIAAADDTSFDGLVDEIVRNVSLKPHAWLDGPIVAKIGSEVVFDARGSYSGVSEIVKYEWDLEADGEYESTTTDPVFVKVFDKPINALATVRVTDGFGRYNVANTHLLVSDDGDDVLRENDNCPDVANSDQLDNDSDNIGDVCDEDAWVTWLLQDEETQKIIHDLGLEDEVATLTNKPSKPKSNAVSSKLSTTNTASIQTKTNPNELVTPVSSGWTNSTTLFNPPEQLKSNKALRQPSEPKKSYLSLALATAGMFAVVMTLLVIYKR